MIKWFCNLCKVELNWNEEGSSRNFSISTDNIINIVRKDHVCSKCREKIINFVESLGSMGK